MPGVVQFKPFTADAYKALKQRQRQRPTIWTSTTRNTSTSLPPKHEPSTGSMIQSNAQHLDTPLSTEYLLAVSAYESNSTRSREDDHTRDRIQQEVPKSSAAGVKDTCPYTVSAPEWCFGGDRNLCEKDPEGGLLSSNSSRSSAVLSAISTSKFVGGNARHSPDNLRPASNNTFVIPPSTVNPTEACIALGTDGLPDVVENKPVIEECLGISVDTVGPHDCLMQECSEVSDKSDPGQASQSTNAAPDQTSQPQPNALADLRASAGFEETVSLLHDDDKLLHLRDVAQLPWANIRNYFDGRSIPCLRRRYELRRGAGHRASRVRSGRQHRTKTDERVECHVGGGLRRMCCVLIPSASGADFSESGSTPKRCHKWERRLRRPPHSHARPC